MITIKNITKDFYSGDLRQNVLKDVNLEIDHGDFLTIMGPSGGGKSTVLHIMGLLIEPTSGEVYYNNNKINFKNERSLDNYRRDNIGLIFQNSNLISCLSPLENLIIAMNSKESYNSKKKKCKELLDKVGLSKKYNSKVSSLSGGEAQRVAVVRALVNEPKVILCDEPTGALDSVNGKNVIELLLNIRKERNCTLIIVTHDEKIGELGERKIYLKDGELHEMARNL
ncbi:ABC transporter ATP-binding protein [Clostridium frigidicarnis]|uniref:Putative ABC transport system ATP-binding protein n=1 Tax=Clostridium frigidicarnis TaxID=84698 RepID=A0A1I1AR13_9CLOT|nr:ABC transporter ATP-binding protein [Clostridium frigidicarnis]SFB40464.1 putative ABC transport system ATP-binding protein [Clostridium frigidicarnis]